MNEDFMADFSKVFRNYKQITGRVYNRASVVTQIAVIECLRISNFDM